MTVHKSIKSLILAAALFVVPVFAAVASPVYAANEGQIEGGDIYRVRNVTKNTAFSDPASADKCEKVQYKVRIHNPGPGELSLVNVKVTLPAGAATSNVSTVVVSSQNANPASTSDTATLNLSSAQTVTYEPGSTQLLDANNGFIRVLPDGITQSGVNIGNVGVSIDQKRFVQFEANINCPLPPPPPPPVTPAFKCDLLTISSDTNRMVTITKFETTATNGAVFKNADINWGDNSPVVTTANVVGQTHQFDKNKDATYTISATARFTVNGADVTAGGPQCTQKITFNSEKPPVITPPVDVPPVVTPPPATPGTPVSTVTTPTTLVNTGPGSIAALFTVVSVLGAVAHRWYIARRLSS